MPKELSDLQIRYLKMAGQTVLRDINGSFNNLDVRKFLGYGPQGDAESIKTILEVEDFLGSNNFIEKTDVPDRFKMSSKGNNYLDWQKTRRSKNAVSKIFKIVSHEITNNIVKAFILFIAFVILDRFALHFIEENKIYKIFQPFEPGLHSAKTVIADTIFVLLSVIIIVKGIKFKTGVLDFLILLVYLFFRLDLSGWYFWTFLSIKHFDFLYIDVIPAYYVCCLAGYFIKYQRVKDSLRDDSYLALDLPLKELSEKLNIDLSAADALGRNKFAYQIADEISIMRPYRAFAIGINGPWGSGKTSLIDLIIDKLKNDNYKDNIGFVDFSPWLSKDSESLIGQFFLLLEKSFNTNKNLMTDLAAYAKAFSAIEKKFFDTEFDFLKEDAGIKERYDNIISAIIRENKLVVIKVDDLDRLTKNEIIDTLRLIRVIANFPNTIYLVGYDKEYINSAISENLTRYKPEQYIHKIFNVEFKIPPVKLSIISERLRKNIEGQFELLFDKNKVSMAQKEKAMVFFSSNSYKNIPHFISNERDIFRFTNNLLMRYLSLKSNINFEDFFILELIHYKYPEIYLDIYLNKSALTT